MCISTTHLDVVMPGGPVPHTYLLTWNPEKYAGDEFEGLAAIIRRDGFASMQWSSGNNRGIRPGDRVFLLRQGKEPRGLVGSGWVIAGSYTDRHWDPAVHRTTQHIHADWDTLSRDPLIHRVQLDAPEFQGVNWNTQISGITIAPCVAERLELAWAEARRTRSHTGTAATSGESSSEGATSAGATFIEGGRITLDGEAYERNPQARAICIAHYGARCVVCRFDFAETYGDAGMGAVHVHHLTPLAERAGEHLIDPVADLRPVCPNCHAMIHRRQPAYSLDEIKQLLAIARAGRAGLLASDI